MKKMFLSAFIAGSLLGSAIAQNVNPGVIPIQSKAHGKSYGEWGAAWWKWAIETPAPINPLIDLTGANCASGQKGAIWFLAGNIFSPDPVNRICTLPAGKTLFFPIANAFSAADPGSGETYESMLAVAKAQVDAIDKESMTVVLDGVKFSNLAKYRAASPEFEIVLPSDNIFGAPPDTYAPAAADGFYLMLTPLKPGTHVLQITANFKTSEPAVNTTYTLIVK